MDEGIIREILERLDQIRETEQVAIPLAVESGSRAWGFPSPDSDYDCRFVFIRSVDQTLNLFPNRDVIETPVTPVFDVNGWELSKAIRLLLKGNAVIVEWLQSPIAYLRNEGFCAELMSLAESVCQRQAIARHYLHLLVQVRDQYFLGTNGVPLKKSFYVLRPAMALRFMRFNPGCRLPPMNFPQLCEASELPGAFRRQIEELLVRKVQTREVGMGLVDSRILEFVNDEAAEARTWVDKPNAPSVAERTKAQTAYLRLLRTYAPL